ncbi:hypothetical protein vBPpSSYP_9 [Pseudomonas phage vB_PpS_SYP]|nr:hypothetical protein vBPpSSYP_9 [Pseudomonas phage vB_PpS_SYP]
MPTMQTVAIARQRVVPPIMTQPTNRPTFVGSAANCSITLPVKVPMKYVTAPKITAINEAVMYFMMQALFCVLMWVF